MGKISGNYNDDDGDDDKPRRKSSTRARKLAEELSIREVGNLDVVEDYIAQAEGIIKWEDLEVVLKREGWVADGTFHYPNEDDSPILYTAHRYVYRKMRNEEEVPAQPHRRRWAEGPRRRAGPGGLQPAGADRSASTKTSIGRGREGRRGL